MEPIHIISLGAGVQSSTMALMAAKGEITPMPAFAVFADTGDEPISVYSHLEWLRRTINTFHIALAHRDPLAGKLSDNIFEWDHSQIPAYTIKDGAVTIGKRQCTKHWKIVPVDRKIRDITDTQRKHLPPGFVTLWMGISVDEISRAKDSRDHWKTHRFPLLEKGMSRRDCLRWLEQNGFPEPPKSSCVFCPYKSDAQWRTSKALPSEWSKIVGIDRKLNARGEFLHKSCLPIDQVDFSTEEERGQLNMFNNECEGMCGV